MEKNQKNKKSNFINDFYGFPKSSDEKPPKAKFDFANFYHKRRFLLWFWFSFVVAAATSVLFICSGASWVIIICFFIFMLLCGCLRTEKIYNYDTCYSNPAIWFIWVFFIWSIYCGCGFLFTKKDFANQHSLGLIIGTVACVIFTFLLPVLNYFLGLNVKSSYSCRNQNDELKPSKNDQKAVYWLVMLVAVCFSAFTVVIIESEAFDLKIRQQKIMIEKQTFTDIMSRNFVVKKNSKDVYALIETDSGVFAVNVLTYPDVCSATTVRLISGEKEKNINGKSYKTVDLIEFETKN